MSACPTCRKETAKQGNPRFPFCCERCRMVDLGKWLGEEYKVPAAPDEMDEFPPDLHDHDGERED